MGRGPRGHIRLPMSTAHAHILLASEVLPPPEAGAQTSASLAREHQERAGVVATAHRGAVLVRVGRGCVSRFGDLDDALGALADLLTPLERGQGLPSRLRASLHRGVLGGGEVPLADPAVAEARGLLAQAGPGEIVLSAGLGQALRDRDLQTSPIPAVAGVSVGLAAHRLLTRPRRPLDQGRRALPGWLLGAAVLVVVLAAVGTLAVSFL